MVDNQAVYVILGIDPEGYKEVLGLHASPTESKSTWMKIFDDIKNRGVQDILFLSMDGVSGLEEGLKSIYPQTIVQRCIVHLIRNATKYIPSKHLKEFCADCKAMCTDGNRHLLGEFIKSRLEKLGLLKVRDPITQNILLSYGAECIEIERFTDINKPIKDDLSNKVYLITF